METEAERILRLLAEYPDEEEEQAAAEAENEAENEANSHAENDVPTQAVVVIRGESIIEHEASTEILQAIHEMGLEVAILEDTDHSKPNQFAVYPDVKSVRGYHFKRSFCISDRNEDLNAALKLGMMTLLVLTKRGEQEKAETFAHLIVRDLNDAYEHLDMLFTRKQKGYDSDLWT